MDARAAFEAIVRELKSDPEKSIVESFYDKRLFGNFWITYLRNGELWSLINDGGQLVLQEGSAADGRFTEVLVDNLRSAEENGVIAAVIQSQASKPSCH